MPPLSLALWEIPEGMPDSPSGPAHVVRSIPWEGGPREFLFRLVELLPQRWIIFAHPAESVDEGNWVVYNSDCTLHVHAFFLADGEAITQRRLIDYLQEVLQSPDGTHDHLLMGRLVVVSIEGENIYALLTSRGEGRWLDQALDLLSRFDAPTKSGLIKDGRHAQHWLAQQLTDFNSEARFSLAWDRLGPDERTEILCGGPERVAEIQTVMRWALQSQRELWEEAPVWNWEITEGPDFGFLAYCSRPNGHDETLTTDFPLFHVLDRFLVKIYIGQLANTTRQRYRCTYSHPERDQYGPDSWTSVELTEPPTAHEQLEAPLLLREWLRANASPEEYEAICQHLKV